MTTLKDLTGWGLYSDQRKQQYKGVWVFTTAYTDNCGFTYYRYHTSKWEFCRDLGYLWKDKNPRGRKLNTKLFLSREEAIERGKEVIDNNIKLY